MQSYEPGPSSSTARLTIVIRSDLGEKLGVTLTSSHGSSGESGTEIELREFMAPHVREIEAHSPAAGVLVVGDTIESVNGQRCTGAQSAARFISDARGESSDGDEGGAPRVPRYTLEVGRAWSWDVVLTPTGSGLGMTLATLASAPREGAGPTGTVILVRGLRPGGVAISSGRLAVGCRIVAASAGGGGDGGPPLSASSLSSVARLVREQAAPAGTAVAMRVSHWFGAAETEAAVAAGELVDEVGV